MQEIACTQLNMLEIRQYKQIKNAIGIGNGRVGAGKWPNFFEMKVGSGPGFSNSPFLVIKFFKFLVLGLF